VGMADDESVNAYGGHPFGWALVARSAALLLLATVATAQEYGVDPMPGLSLDDDGAGQSPAHQLEVLFAKGQLEIYRATVQYPNGFEFNGFDVLGPPNSPVGVYALDLNDDGAADVSADVLSAGPDRAYVDVIADGAFSPDLEPSLSISRTAEVAITFPLGGDALSTTVMVPWDARAKLILFAGLLASPTAGGRYDIEVHLVSVDPDTDGPDDGVAPDPLAVEITLGVDIVATGPAAF